MPTVKVKLHKNLYPVIIESSGLEKLEQQLTKHVKSGKLFVFVDANFYALHHVGILKVLKKFKGTNLMVLPSGEKIKSERMLSKLHSYLLSEKISRTDFILACGGGVTSDLVGYLAASVLRGVRWGIVSTTLLGMVDASIGGKTGINHSEGKNLIGAFHQPSFVFCNTEYLQTLSEKEIMCGLGEIIKYAGLIGADYLKLTNNYLLSENRYDDRYLKKLIILSASYKSDIVSRDETENRLRMLLNLGHTFGHAIEKINGYKKISHGEAVLIGLLGTVALSEKIDPKTKNALKSYKSLILNAIQQIPKINLAENELLSAMALDKKRQGDDINFILLKKPGKPFIRKGISKALIKKSLKEMIKLYENHGGKIA